MSELSTYRQQASPLPIDRLFLKMATRYGRQWVDLWAGIPIDEVKSDWQKAIVKHGFTLRTVLLAAENESQKFPPNLNEFVATCKALTPKPYSQAIGRKFTEAEIEANKKRLYEAALTLTVKPKFLKEK